jgi:hypothetical protein
MMFNILFISCQTLVFHKQFTHDYDAPPEIIEDSENKMGTE